MGETAPARGPQALGRGRRHPLPRALSPCPARLTHCKRCRAAPSSGQRRQQSQDRPGSPRPGGPHPACGSKPSASAGRGAAPGRPCCAAAAETLGFPPATGQVPGKAACARTARRGRPRGSIPGQAASHVRPSQELTWETRIPCQPAGSRCPPLHFACRAQGAGEWGNRGDQPQVVIAGFKKGHWAIKKEPAS